MGNRLDANPSLNLDHLTLNSDNQEMLRSLYATNQAVSLGPAGIYANYYSNFEEKIDIKVKKSTPKKITLSLKKDSLRLIKSKEDPDKLYLSFTYNITHKACITIFLCANETINPDTKKTLNIKAAPDHIFSLKSEQARDAKFPSLAFISENELKKHLKLDENEYTVIIKMEEDEDEFEKKGKEIIYSYGRLGERREGNEYVIEIIKQKIEVDDKGFLMYEIFGGKLTENKTRDDLLCAICLTFKSNVIVYPCEHLCICYRCCLDLKEKTKKCPICRKNIESFIKLQKRKKM